MQATTPGSRPHDPLAARDGSLWYTGQMANVLGRVDPKTGGVAEYPLKTKHSGPHGLGEDKEGNIWYTGNTGALIGKLDPKTGAVAEHPMPHPEAKHPHTLIFDRSGEWQSPSGPKSEPYGISAINDVIRYSESGSTPNTVVRFDPKTSKFQSRAIPGGGKIVRNTSVTADGDFVLANSLVNTITLVTVSK